jgi:tetratricopeptide (TPR) repeat protein
MNKRLLLILPAIAAACVLFQMRVDVEKTRLRERQSRPFVPPRPGAVKVAALGYHTLLADVYWLEAIQYFAETIDKGKPPNDLYAMADFITDLDPHFCFAYYFTGLNLFIEGGRGRYVVEILEKGKKNCPTYWKIPFQLGFYYYYALDRYEPAAEDLELAYKLTGYNGFALLASRIRAEGGTPEFAIRFLSEMVSQTEDPQAKAAFMRRIQELRAEVIISDLDDAVDLYSGIEGRYPRDPGELIAAGLISGVPPHPVPAHRFVYLSEQHRFENDPPIQNNVYDVRKKKATLIPRTEGG